MVGLGDRSKGQRDPGVTPTGKTPSFSPEKRTGSFEETSPDLGRPSGSRRELRADDVQIISVVQRFFAGL